MGTIVVEGRLINRLRPLFPEFELPLPAGAGATSPTLREMLEQVVRGEVAAFRERREARGLTHVLTPLEVEVGAARGRITPGGREGEPDADPEEAVRTALQAFADGLFYVFVDEQQVTDLDAPVRLRPRSRVTFLRLVALAGG